jgi:hypothetical protein
VPRLGSHIVVQISPYAREIARRATL